MERFAVLGLNGLIFIGSKGVRVRRSNFRKFWNQAGMRSACVSS
jgi:hypothetical protein